MNLFEIARAHVNGRSIPHKINKSNQHAIAQIIKDQKKRKKRNPYIRVICTSLPSLSLMKRKPMCREREGNCVSGREKRTSRANKRCSVNYHLFMCGRQAYLEQDGRRGGTTSTMFLPHHIWIVCVSSVYTNGTRTCEAVTTFAWITPYWIRSRS